MTRALVIQLARLGDLLQTAPAVAALTARHPGVTFDLLCPAHLAEIGRLLPGVRRVLSWDGPAWRRRADAASDGLEGSLQDAVREIEKLAPEPYDRAYVLNQHPRALLAGALLARATTGPRLDGPFGERLAPWADYVREVARLRRGRRVHLADVFCGLCGVSPPGRPIVIEAPPEVALPAELCSVGQRAGPWVALIVGAGEAERIVPVPVWQEWIARFLTRVPRGRIVLVGQERERGRQMQEKLPPSLLGRIWDATGRTSLTELAVIVRRCHRAIGADTGPLHLAAALGVPVLGWYFARARVHETGPYGLHHLVWQAGQGDDSSAVRPDVWPVDESVEALVTGAQTAPGGWSLWLGQCDRWGAFYSEAGGDPRPPREREALWHELHQAVG